MSSFITDSGSPTKIYQGDKLITTLPQYGYWTDKGRRKPEVVECSNNLEHLKEKYSCEKVVELK